MFKVIVVILFLGSFRRSRFNKPFFKAADFFSPKRFSFSFYFFFLDRESNSSGKLFIDSFARLHFAFTILISCLFIILFWFLEQSVAVRVHKRRFVLRVKYFSLVSLSFKLLFWLPALVRPFGFVDSLRFCFKKLGFLHSFWKVFDGPIYLWPKSEFYLVSFQACFLIIRPCRRINFNSCEYLYSWFQFFFSDFYSDKPLAWRRKFKYSTNFFRAKFSLEIWKYSCHLTRRFKISSFTCYWYPDKNLEKLL